MIKDLQITLYDIFGFLLPGSVTAAALLITFWAIFWPLAALTIPANVPVFPTTLLLLGAYLSGHLVQAMSNVVENLSKQGKHSEISMPLSTVLEKMLRESVAKQFGQET